MEVGRHPCALPPTCKILWKRADTGDSILVAWPALSIAGQARRSNHLAFKHTVAEFDRLIQV